MGEQALRARLEQHAPALAALVSFASHAAAVLTVDLSSLHACAEALRGAGFSRLDMVTAIDRGETLELVYHLEATDPPAQISVRCAVGRDHPVVPTMFDLWPSADWQEREVFDLFGIDFAGHPDMRRILLADDWEGFPLRKDYEDDWIVRRPDYI
jgi:NADH-quinone oxidoreductase subunit C